MKLLQLFFLTLLSITLPLSAQFDPFDDAEKVKDAEISLSTNVSTVAPGETVRVLATITHPKGWHAYYKNSGGVNLPLDFEWKLPEGFEVAAFHWPTPHLYNDGQTTSYTYEGTYSLIGDITVPTTAKAGDKVSLELSTTWQICDVKGCKLPETESHKIEVTIGEKTEINADTQKAFDTANAAFPKNDPPWDITSEVTDNFIVLTLTENAHGTELKPTHYIDNHGFTDSSKPQTITKTDKGFTIKVARNAENDATGKKITGILVTSDHHSYYVGEQVGYKAPEKKALGAGAHGITSDAPTEADIKAAAALYDADKKIDFVLLDGTKEKELTLLTALGLIFIGGLLLNLMPCVFPVLGIKVMGFAEQAGQDPKKIKLHGLTFMAGLVMSMWVLAGIIYVLIFSFQKDVNWGEQLSSPEFLAGMIVLLFLFGLNMAGVFEIGTSLTGAGGDLQRKKGYSGSFFSGVLTTLIATPCSGPFLGSVMAYTLKQPPLQGMLIFTVFALGIASPYVVLAFFPALINKLPRPGAWMETFKQLMSFALFATAAYFFRSFAKITGVGAASWFLLAIVVIGLAAWAYGRFGKPFTPKTKRYVWGFAFPLLITVGAFVMTKSAVQERAPAPPLTGSSWYPGVVELNRSKGRIVWVDYTADW